MRQKAKDRGCRDWYQLARWRRIRRHQLRKEPLCRMCLARGRAVPASIADHVVRHGGDWNEFWTGELQSLCFDCHNADKQAFEWGGKPRLTYGPDGWPIG
jgi:5-methylcytosine-specific restriction protein A